MTVEGLSTVVWLMSSLSTSRFWMLCSNGYSVLHHLPLILCTDFSTL